MHSPSVVEYLLLSVKYLLSGSQVSCMFNCICITVQSSYIFHVHRQHEQVPAYTPYEDGTGKSVPKCRHIKFRCWGINQKKEYNIQNKVKVWNQEWQYYSTTTIAFIYLNLVSVPQQHNHLEYVCVKEG